MTLHVFGDSHSKFLFERFKGAQIHWLGPVTMHRVGRDGLQSLVKDEVTLGPDDWAVFVFGEIDLRCHLLKVADEQGSPREKVIEDTASRYMAAISAFCQGHGVRNAVICGVVPPADPIWKNADYPVYGSLKERIAARRFFNKSLRSLSREHGMAFLSIPRRYETWQGGLKRYLSDGGLHIASDCTGAVCRQLAKVIGLALQFRGESPTTVLKRYLQRHFLKPDDPAVLWDLGKTLTPLE
jgi:lysophospholipase L1-like esterase